MIRGDRPVLTSSALRRWSPLLIRRLPDLVSAYLVPGRLTPRIREATMLGVTSVNRCVACARVHERSGRAVELDVQDPLGFAPGEASGYLFGQAVATVGPARAPLPAGVSARHRRELAAVAILMELANLAGNRFLAEGGSDGAMQIGGVRSARLYDLAMRVADRAGLRRARHRIAGGADGAVLEIGIGTGLNLAAYPPDVSLHAIDPSAAALSLASTRASRLGRRLELRVGDAAALPYPDGAFDTVVGTFVLCSVGDVALTLRETRRVLGPGGQVRFLEHGRSGRGAIAGLQTRLAPAWSRAAGGCRLDQDVRAAIEAAGLRIVNERTRGSGLLVEIVAVPD